LVETAGNLQIDTIIP